MLTKILIAVSLTIGAACVLQSTPMQPSAESTPPGQSSLVVAGGCFWCLESQFEMLKGVSKVESCYAGGTVPNPTYEQVCTGTTGHAEAVKITFDPKVISADDLLHIFFTIHDPTTLNRQGPDHGTQYRSAIFYANDAEKALAMKVLEEIEREKIWPNPIVTTIEPLKNYSLAEEYHQDYYKKFEEGTVAQKMGMNAGYCTAVIEPKVAKFRQKYAHLLKGK